MPNMRAVLVKRPGSAEGLEISEVPKLTPKENELLVRVRSFALNRMDILQRDGQYPVPDGVPKDILGVEFAGDVVEAGSSVKDFKVKDRVFGLISGGAYAEYVTIPEKMAMAIPESWSYQHATAVPEVWFTAYQALHFITKIKEGDNVLIHAGASGVGTAAIQLAKLAKAKTIIVTAGHQRKLEFCRSLGATHGINYKTEKFAEKVPEYTGNKGADVVIDFIGGSYWNDNLQSLALDGRMVMLALMGGVSVKDAGIGTILRKRLKIEGSTLRSRSLEYQIELRNAVVKDVLPFLQNGTLKPIVDREYSWDQIVDAHKHMESNDSIGKIVVNVP